jgi:hypothetical protein
MILFSFYKHCLLFYSLSTPILCLSLYHTLSIYFWIYRSLSFTLFYSFSSADNSRFLFFSYSRDDFCSWKSVSTPRYLRSNLQHLWAWRIILLVYWIYSHVFFLYYDLICDNMALIINRKLIFNGMSFSFCLNSILCVFSYL